MRSSKKWCPIALALCLALGHNPSAASAQESVNVPQLLQQDVHSFNLTIDSLKTLTANIEVITSRTLRELQAIQQKMHLLQPGSRAYQVEARRLEKKLSAYLAQKYTALMEMQNLRLETLQHLEKILAHLQMPENRQNEALAAEIRENIRQNEERITQAQIEILGILTTLEKPDVPQDEVLRLNRKLQLVQNNQLALYQQNRARFADLLALANQRDQELPALQNAIATMQESLLRGFEWIETEMTFIDLYTSYRKNRLDVQARLIEAGGLLEKFREAIEQINSSNRTLQGIEYFEKMLSNGAGATNHLPSLPELYWPGQPQRSSKQPLTASEIDSLRQAIEQQLKGTKQQ